MTIAAFRQTLNFYLASPAEQSKVARWIHYLTKKALASVEDRQLQRYPFHSHFKVKEEPLVRRQACSFN